MEIVERLDAIERIKAVKARYFRGVDSKDCSLLRDVFADDVEIDYRGSATDPVTGVNIAPGATDDVLRGGDHAADVVSKALIGVTSVHHGSIPEIEITGPTTAKAIWPMVDRLLFSSGVPFKELIGYGHYHETYELRDGSWRIKTMKLIRTRIDTISN